MDPRIYKYIDEALKKWMPAYGMSFDAKIYGWDSKYNEYTLFEVPLLRDDAESEYLAVGVRRIGYSPNSHSPWAAVVTSKQYAYVSEENKNYDMKLAIEAAIKEYATKNPEKVQNKLKDRLGKLREIVPPSLLGENDIELLDRLIEHFRWMPGGEEYRRAEENFEKLRGQN